VTVKDASNNPVAGVAVTFAVATGGGSATGTSQTTDVNGIATVGSWTLGNTAGSNTLTATSGTLSGSPVTFTATGTAGPASTIAISAGNGQSATVNTAVGTLPAVIVHDPFGNPVAGVGVTFAVATGNGSLTGASQTTEANGIATVGSWTLGTAAGSNTLTATSGTLAGSPVTFTATATAGPASSIAINAGNGQSATVNTAVATPPSVVVHDQFGNAVEGVGVTFAAASGGGSITGASQTTNASGIATVGSWTLGTAAGGNTLTATSGSLSGSPVTFTATGTAGNAAQIAINGGNGQSATVNTAVAVAPSVIVTDAFGNPVSGTSVTFAVGLGGGSIIGAGATTDANGIATVGSWTLGTTAGTNTLTASSGSLSGSPVTFTATGTAGAATKLVFTGQPTDAAANATITPPVVVTAQDQFGNTATTFSGSIAVSITLGTGNPLGQLNGNTIISANAGVATFPDLSITASNTLLLFPSYSLTAQAGGVGDGVSNTFDITP
jgi:adhesin/invasin